LIWLCVGPPGKSLLTRAQSIQLVSLGIRSKVSFESYVTADGQSASLSWCQAFSRGHSELVSYTSPVGLTIIFSIPDFQTPSTWKARSQYLYPPGTGLPSYTPRNRGLFSSSLTTCIDMIEIFGLSHQNQHKTAKNGVFWDVTPCGFCKNRRFGRTLRLFHQSDRNR
jgi:hypothetical protein